MKLRIQFHKLGPVRFTSHKDTIRMFQRCFAAAGIPVAYSEGFHPHMRLSFAPPLKTGWEGYDEYLDVEVTGPPGEMRDTCNARLPEGLRINHVYVLSDRAPKIAADIAAADIAARLRADDVAVDGLEGRLRERFVGSVPDGAGAANGDEPRVLDIRVSSSAGGVEIRYTTTMISGRIVRADGVLSEFLPDPDALEAPPAFARLAQYVERGGEFVSPISKGVLVNKS